MFYAQFVLSKKGPLAKIWLAAHWEKKLSKAQVYETNVSDAVEEILKPKVKMALRTTGHLLLGIVRIYARRAAYLLEDCENASLKINLSFSAGGKSKGAVRNIDISDLDQMIVGDFDATIPDHLDLSTTHVPVNQSRIDDITIKENNAANGDFDAFDNDNAGLDDFGENGADFGELDEDAVEVGRRAASIISRQSVGPAERNHSLLESGEGKNMEIDNNDFIDNNFDNDFSLGDANDLDNDLFGPDNFPNNRFADNNNLGIGDSFQLEPLEVGSVVNERVNKRKRRRLIIDEIKNITGDEMKANMASFDDILSQPDLAPPTKKLMHLREHGVTEKLFSMPGCQALTNPDLVRIYQSHLVPRAKTIDEGSIQDIRRDLELSDAVDYFDNNFDNGPDFDHPTDLVSTTSVPPFEPIEEVDENIQPDDQPSPTKDSEKRTPRKPRQEKEKPAAAEESGEEDEDEHRCSKRTHAVAKQISTRLKSYESITLNDLLTKGSTRKSAAQKFYALLELAKWQAIEVVQEESYGDITIMEGAEMQTVLTSN